MYLFTVNLRTGRLEVRNESARSGFCRGRAQTKMTSRDRRSRSCRTDHQGKPSSSQRSGTVLKEEESDPADGDEVRLSLSRRGFHAAFTFRATDVREWRRRSRQRAGADLERKNASLRTCGEACGPHALPGGRAALPEQTDFLSSAKAGEFIKRERSGCLTDWRERSFSLSLFFNCLTWFQNRRCGM